MAWVIGIIIISAFSASWAPEKVREQHEDRLISMLVLASIWQQTIGKGLGPGHSSMHRTAPTDKTPQHTEAVLTTVGHRTATQQAGRLAGWLNDWLHSGGLTIKDSGEMAGGKKQIVNGKRATERNTAQEYKKSHFCKVKIMNLLPLNSCLIHGTNLSFLARMATMRKAFIIYEEDFDLFIETLPLCVSLVKALSLMKRCEQ